MQEKTNFKPLFIRYSGAVIEANNGEKMRLTPRSVERVIKKYVLRSGFQWTQQCIHCDIHSLQIYLQMGLI